MDQISYISIGETAYFFAWHESGLLFVFLLLAIPMFNGDGILRKDENKAS